MLGIIIIALFSETSRSRINLEPRPLKILLIARPSHALSSGKSLTEDKRRVRALSDLCVLKPRLELGLDSAQPHIFLLAIQGLF